MLKFIWVIRMESKHDEILSIGDRINFIIESKNLKKTDFARITSISKTHISDVINNKEKLSPSTIKLICKIFDVNEDWLINGEGDIYIDKAKHKSHVERILKEFDSLNPDFQDIAIIFFSFLSKIQDRINKKKN